MPCDVRYLANGRLKAILNSGRPVRHGRAPLTRAEVSSPNGCSSRRRSCITGGRIIYEATDFCQQQFAIAVRKAEFDRPSWEAASRRRLCTTGDRRIPGLPCTLSI